MIARKPQPSRALEPLGEHTSITILFIDKHINVNLHCTASTWHRSARWVITAP